MPNLPALFRQQFTLRSVVKWRKIDTIVDASGYAKPAIFIDVEGDEWEETIDRSTTLVKECELSAEEIVKKIADAGIVGLGGACFPTQVKLCPPPSFRLNAIINAVECELTRLPTIS